jgi:hypothetical protein
MYKIYDDAIDKNDLRELCSQLTGNRFTWFLSPAVMEVDVLQPEDYDRTKYNIQQFAMFHLLLDNGIQNSSYSPVAQRLIDSFCKKNGITYTKVIRAQFNLVFQHPNSDLPSCPHVDNKLFPHGVLLFYLHDADGDTFLYEDNSREIKERVSPKAGRVLAFDGTHVHSAGTPQKSVLRLVMNCNLLDMKWTNDESNQT